MPTPEALAGNKWTHVAARAVLPLVVRCAQKGDLITYGQLDDEFVRRGGHHVVVVQYGHPAGAIGSALIELEGRWGMSIPPLNAIIVNAKTRLPGKGVNYYLKHYFKLKNTTQTFSLKQRQAIVEEIQADVYAFKHWGRVLRACQLNGLHGARAPREDKQKEILLPRRGGWSTEPESKDHRRLKEYVAKHPAVIGLPRTAPVGRQEYVLFSADKADVLFKSVGYVVGVEVKSRISNDADLNRGIFQAIKYQALLRAEQKARLEAPMATAVLVTERDLPHKLAQRASLLGIEVVVVKLPAQRRT